MKGLGTALITPFMEDGTIDFQSLSAMIEHQVNGGVDYLVIMGTTSEAPTITHEEQDQIIAHVVKQVAGRVPLVLGVGGNSTAAVVQRLEELSERLLTDFAAILSVTPYYNRPQQEGLYLHFSAVAEASPVPVILYNVPGRTGVNLLPDTAIRLANECKNIIAIKEASGKIEQFDELLAKRPEGFMVISGDDGMALEVIKHGGDGLISVAANAFPEQYAQMITKQFDKEYDTTQQLWEKVAAVTKLLFEEGNPTGIKAALAAKGICNNKLRLPLVPSSDSLYERIRELILQENL